MVASLATGSAHAGRPAVQESSEPWFRPCCKYVTAPLGQFCLAEREKSITMDVEKLLGTYVFTFVCWHLRKIAQELLGHIAHIVATLQLLFFLLWYNIS